MIDFVILTWQTLEEFNQSGVEGLIRFSANTWSGLIPLILFGLWLIIVISSYFGAQRTTGQGNLPASFSVASFVVLVISIVGFSLITDLINLFTLIVCFIASVLSVLWLLLSD